MKEPHNRILEQFYPKQGCIFILVKMHALLWHPFGELFKGCVAQSELCIFRCVASGCALFCFQEEKEMKKVISLVLVFAIVLTLMAGMGISSDAATAHNQTEAVSWANSQVGKSLDYDGVYGAQCVDLIKYYYKYLGLNPVTGNGSDYASNSLPSGWSRIKYYSGFVAQPGDVAVWSYLSSSAGHVGIVTSANSTGMNLVDQNGATAPAHVVKTCWKNYSSGTFYGVIRPDFSGGGTTAPNPVNYGADCYAYIIKQDGWKHIANVGWNVKLPSANDCYDPKQIWHFVRQSNGSYKILNEYDGVSCLNADSMSADDRTNINIWGDNGSQAQRWYIYDCGSGFCLQPTYCNKVLDVDENSNLPGANVHLFTKNSSGAQIFSIYRITNDGWTYSKPARPNKPTVTITTTSSGAKFSWTASPTNGKLDSRVYDLRVFKRTSSGDNLFYSKFGLNTTSHSVTLDKNCKYTVTVCAVNSKYSNYYTSSDSQSFSFDSSSCSHSYSSKITTANTCTTAGVKTFTCSKCGNQYTQTIAALGHNYSGSVTKAATCAEKGIKTFKCSRCTSSYTQDIAALGHDIKTKIYKKAEVTQTVGWDGSTADYCTRCDYLNIHYWTINGVRDIDLSKTAYTYSGNTVTPSVKVVDWAGKVLKQGTDYTVKYASGRKNIGKYAVKVSFQGKYTGSRMLYFKIVPKGTSLSKLTAGKKAFTAKWKKLSGITGYQIQYSTNAKFTGAKTVTVKGATAAGKTIKNLKAKQVYYVCVRTYKTVSGTHYMSNWSKTYKVKTK